ncbi:MAG: hypothetical protein JRC86_13585 [Deltaproteobacteria bacterium]|nr:hypothetical protein [Deltaproteobacteria bacterium]
MDNAKSEILRMAEDRRRTGKNPLTDEEVLARHYAIRDGAMIWMEQCVAYGKDKGVVTAQKLYDHASRCIDNLERKRKR